MRAKVLFLVVTVVGGLLLVPPAAPASAAEPVLYPADGAVVLDTAPTVSITYPTKGFRLFLQVHDESVTPIRQVCLGSRTADDTKVLCRTRELIPGHTYHVSADDLTWRFRVDGPRALSSVPAEGSVMATGPAEVRVRFDRALAAASRLRVYLQGNGPRTSVAGSSTLDGQDLVFTPEAALPLGRLAAVATAVDASSAAAVVRRTVQFDVAEQTLPAAPVLIDESSRSRYTGDTVTAFYLGDKVTAHGPIDAVGYVLYDPDDPSVRTVTELVLNCSELICRGTPSLDPRNVLPRGPRDASVYTYARRGTRVTSSDDEPLRVRPLSVAAPRVTTPDEIHASNVDDVAVSIASDPEREFADVTLADEHGRRHKVTVALVDGAVRTHLDARELQDGTLTLTVNTHPEITTVSLVKEAVPLGLIAASPHAGGTTQGRAIIVDTNELARPGPGLRVSDNRGDVIAGMTTTTTLSRIRPFESDHNYATRLTWRPDVPLVEGATYSVTAVAFALTCTAPDDQLETCEQARRTWTFVVDRTPPPPAHSVTCRFDPSTGRVIVHGVALAGNEVRVTSMPLRDGLGYSQTVSLGYAWARGTAPARFATSVDGQASRLRVSVLVRDAAANTSPTSRPASCPGGRATQLTLTAPPTATRGSVLPLDGRLSYADSGGAISAATVRLEIAHPGTTFRPLQNGTTRADGGYTFRPRFGSTARYRVRFVDNPNIVDALSPTREVRLVG